MLKINFYILLNIYMIFLTCSYTFRIIIILRVRSGKVSVEVFTVIAKLRGMSRKRVRYTFDVHFGSQ